jgi:DNA-binding transcriptional LysR family regulator
MLDWEDLRHFAALAREGSLSGAARQLRVNHTTVARRVASVEAALASKLVDRRPRSCSLTAEGRRVAALVARMEEDAFAVARLAQAERAGLQGEATLTAPPSLASAVIAPRLPRLYQRHPGLRLRLRGEKRVVSLSRREADLAVRLVRPVEAALVARRVGTVEFGLYGATSYLASHPPSEHAFIANDVDLDEVPQQRWLTALVGSRAVVLRTSDVEIQVAAARAGVGLAVLPRYVGDAQSSLVRVDATPARVTRPVWLVVHRDLRKAPLVRAVAEFVVECLAHRIAPGATAA